jgi:hypothetical protein
MALTLSDIYRWTMGRDGSRNEDFLSLAVARLASRSQPFARELARLCGHTVPTTTSIQVRAQRLVEGRNGGLRTDIELLWPGHRLVIECKVETAQDDRFHRELQGQLRSYQDTTPRPVAVVPLLVRPWAREGITWWDLHCVLERSEDADWRELAQLLRTADVVEPLSVRPVTEEAWMHHAALTEKLTVAIKSALPLLVPASARDELRRRLAAGDQEWSESEVGWTWGGRSALPGTNVKGISLHADAEGSDLHWWLEVMPSNEAARAALRAASDGFEVGPDDWWISDLGACDEPTLGDQLAHATRRARLALRMAPSLYPELMDTVGVSRSRLGTPTSAAVSAILTLRETALAGAALQREAVLRLHARVAFLDPDPVWGRSTSRTRFYAMGRRLEFGAVFRDQHVGVNGRIRLWVWASTPRVRSWVEHALGEARVVEPDDDETSLYVPIGGDGVLDLRVLHHGVDEVARRLRAALDTFPAHD